MFGKVVAQFEVLETFDATLPSGVVISYYKGGTYNLREGNAPLAELVDKWVDEGKVKKVEVASRLNATGNVTAQE